MVSQLFTEISAAVTGMISAVSAALTGVTSIFYDATNGFTFIGILLLIAIGGGLVFWAVYLIMRLCRRSA